MEHLDITVSIYEAGYKKGFEESLPEEKLQEYKELAHNLYTITNLPTEKIAEIMKLPKFLIESWINEAN